MKVINLYGGPGSGKSTTAAGIFYKMKLQHYSVELVTEFAKDMVYDGQGHILRSGRHQGYIFARQHYRLQRLIDHVEWAVTDCPVLLGLAYVPPDDLEREAIFQMATTAHGLYDSYNFFLNRPSSYQQYGRVHSQEEALEIDRRIKQVLIDRRVSFWVLETSPTVADQIVDIVINMETKGESE